MRIATLFAFVHCVIACERNPFRIFSIADIYFWGNITVLRFTSREKLSQTVTFEIEEMLFHGGTRKKDPFVVATRWGLILILRLLLSLKEGRGSRTDDNT